MMVAAPSVTSDPAWLLELVEPDLLLLADGAELTSGVTPREGAFPLDPLRSWELLSLSPEREREMKRERERESTRPVNVQLTLE